MKLALSVAVASLALSTAVFGAEMEASSSIDAVTVYPAGAEVTRIAKVKLAKGDHTIFFRDLPAGAVDGSIRIEGSSTGKLEIGSVDARRLYVTRADGAASETERRRIETEIEKLQDEKARLEAAVRGAETQKTLLNNLAGLPSRPAPSAGGDRSEDWPSILALIASGTIEAQRLQQDAQIKIREVERTIEDLEKKLSALAPEQEERTEAKVFVTAQAELEADITVRYQVTTAAWTPLYDVRLSTGAKTAPPAIELIRRAAINQQSGEPWANVALTLSTTRPAAGATAPELFPIVVDYPPEPAPYAAAPAAPVAMSRAARDRVVDGLAAEADLEEKALERQASKPKLAIEGRTAAVVAAPFHALYAVPGRVDIPDTGETKRVELLKEMIEPQLTVRTVPKVDPKAYLYAKLVLPKGSTPLLAGAASLFRDGTFVGKGELRTQAPGDEVELGFGADDLVRVRYAVAEEKRGETGLITTSRTDVRNYRLTVKSLHDSALALQVFDQVPVSENQEIKVETIGKAPSRQNVDDKRGVFAWDSRLEPDQEQVIEFGYRVTWPSAKSIIYR